MASAIPTVERTTHFDASAEEVWTWHTRPGAFERLSPPWERVEVLERSGGVEEGARTVVRVRVGPAALRWEAVHRDGIPGRQFVDEQVSGPFSSWVHTHRIDPDGAGGSRLTDRVQYTAPFGPAGAASEGLLVRPRVERLLAYRHRVLQGDLAAHRRFAAEPPLHVGLTGATGLVGSALRPFLTTGGHRVTPIVRRAPKAGEIGWRPDEGRLDAAALEGVDAVVHLAGENIAKGRWTPERKRRILESRTRGTRLLAETLARLPRPPRVLVSASAVGIYGSRGDELLTESSAHGDRDDFLVQTAEAWEAATEPARAAGIRVVHLRLGVILSPAGGALARLRLPFLAGVGGRIGSGRQWMSWITIDDAIGAIHHALFTRELAGAVNAMSPVPVTNATFTATLGRVLHRPTLLPVPPAALRLVFGEMAEGTILASQRVMPERLLASGYPFRYPDLEPALRHVLGRE